MTRNQVLSVESPRYEHLGPLVLVGLEAAFTAETRDQIPQLWQSLRQSSANIPGRCDQCGYGVIRNNGDAPGFRYLAGVQISDSVSSPPELQLVRLDAARYVVFTHRQHVSKLFNTMCAIYRDWLPHAEVSLADQPCFELYGEDFDVHNGLGLIEIWLPIIED